MPLLEGLIEIKILRILKTLLDHPSKLFHLNSLAKTSKVPVSSTARIIKKLVKHSLAQETKIGKISVYRLAHNQKTKQIQKIL